MRFCSVVQSGFALLPGFEWVATFSSFTGFDQGISSLLQVPPMVGNLGTGLLYIVCWVLGIGFANGPEQAALPTYEYGWTFLIIAGLLELPCDARCV